MRFAYWITRVTNTLRICNTYRFSTATMVSRTRLNITLYIHCLTCEILCFYKTHVPIPVLGSSCRPSLVRQATGLILCNFSRQHNTKLRRTTRDPKGVRHSYIIRQSNIHGYTRSVSDLLFLINVLGSDATVRFEMRLFRCVGSPVRLARTAHSNDRARNRNKQTSIVPRIEQFLAVNDNSCTVNANCLLLRPFAFVSNIYSTTNPRDFCTASLHTKNK